MILIVDDRPENLFSLRRILEVNGYAVDTALSGNEALKKILKNSYQLLILDVQMPEMDGFELGDTVRGYSATKDIPIIYLSAVNKDKEFIARGYEVGGLDYIVKPVDPDILLLKVSTVVKLSREKSELQTIKDTLTEEINLGKAANMNLARERDSLTVEIQEGKIANDTLTKERDNLSAEVAQGKLDNENLKLEMLELEKVLASLPLIAFTINKHGHVEYVNRNWYNYSETPSVFPEVHVDDANFRTGIENALEKGEAFETTFRIRHLESREFHHHHLKLTPVSQKKRPGRWIGTLTNVHKDVLDKQLLEEKVQERTQDLQRRNEELTSANHELEQFAWVVSHDLKEPLRKIEIFSNLIQERFLPEESGGHRYFNRMIQSSRRMSMLINDLLDYSRLSSERLFEKTNLNELIQDVLTDFEEEIEQKKAEIKVDKFPVIDAIPGQIRQVFQNLIGNALKFSKPDLAPSISISSEKIDRLDVLAEADAAGPYLKISIIDNGIGFDEKFLEKIFIIFQRLDNPVKKTNGTGIGLPIARKITSKHNGILSARSTEGEGSEFILILPLTHQHVNTQLT